MKLVSKNSIKNKKVLLTCGPTWIPVDDMRIISNRSSGEMGQTIALSLAENGAKVTLLEGPVIKPLVSKNIKVIKFSFFDELLELMHQEINKKYDIIIHAAAVSDYKCKKKFNMKISSKLKGISLELIPTQKIITFIKKSCPKTFLVGFKLESKMNEKLAVTKTRDLFTRSKCDLVIANSIKSGKYNGYIVDPNNNFIAHKTSKKEIANALISILKDKL
ncbi:MAG: hypothetical protein KKF78_03380 [Candidatus Omnitrophica bacterium]|nr:hypothetical protein [Candidatus Omnitrophota bacterium]MBU1996180.1 hypothetical protein [Candidatus Omnitrophota bacterium]